MKLIYIKWTDACSSPSWFTKEDALKWARSKDWIVENIGWLMEETDKYILICARRSDDVENRGEYGLLQKIPKTWIIKRKILK